MLLGCSLCLYPPHLSSGAEGELGEAVSGSECAGREPGLGEVVEEGPHHLRPDGLRTTDQALNRQATSQPLSDMEDKASTMTGTGAVSGCLVITLTHERSSVSRKAGGVFLWASAKAKLGAGEEKARYLCSASSHCQTAVTTGRGGHSIKP